MLALDTAIAMEGSLMRIGSLELDAGGNRVTARGTLDTATLRGHGELIAEAPDLVPLRTWLKMPLEGGFSLQASLTEASDTLTGQLSVTGLVVDSTRIGEASGRFDIADIFGSPAGTASLTAGGLEVGDIELATLILSAEGPPGALDLGLSAEGIYQEFTRFKVDGGGQYSNAALAFDLRDLNFGVEDFAFALRDPASFSWGEDALTLSPLVLESASGTIEASGQLLPDSVDARLAWSGVSLRLVELAGIDPADGAVSGTVTMSGAPSAPTAHVEATVDGYRPRPDESAPGLDLQVTAHVTESALSADFMATAGEGARFQGSAGLPVAFGLAPWHFEVPERAPLSGSLTGSADLAVVAPLLPLEGHALQGDLDADLSARGTLDAPRLGGAVTVSDGYYENGSTSTILDDIALRLEADGDTLRLTEFTANDTAGGTVTGEGQIAFRPSEGSPYAVKLVLDKPRLVYRDDFRAEGSGELSYTGDADGAALNGHPDR